MSRKPGKDDVAKALHDWALKEMYFHHRGQHAGKPLPTADNFSQICKGEMGEIWRWVIQNVYSAQTVKKVQGNILLKQKHSLPHASTYKVQYGSGEHYNQLKAELLDKRRALLTKLTSARCDISDLERDLTKTHTELAHIQQRYQEKTGTLRDSQRKAAILNAHCQHVQEEIEKVAEYKQRVNTRVKTLTDRKGSVEEQCYSRTSTSSDPGQSLETASTKCVRETCDSVYDFLHHMLRGSFGTDTDVVLGGGKKERLWVQVETVMSNYSPNQVLLSLTICAQDSAYSLKEKTAAIDIKKDAEQLRFKYESPGQLSDLSTQPSVLKSVHQLLEEGQTQQIRRFMDTERAINSAWKLQYRLSQTQQLVHDYLTQCYKDRDHELLKLAKAVFETELQIVTTQTAIRTLGNEADVLKERNSLALREKETLFDKYQKIQDFKKMADNKQNLIRILVKQNMEARSRLEKHQSEIIQYVEKSFGGQEQAAQNLADRLTDSVIHEVDTFTVLSLPNLLFTVLDSAYKMTVIDLSIYRLSANQNTVGGQVIKRLLEALEFPSYKAPEDLLVKVVELQCEVTDIERAIDSHSNSAHTARPSGHTEHSLVNTLQDLGGEVNSHDQKQLENLLPVLQKRLNDISETLTNCLHVKDLLQQWWEQPAQWTAEWVKIDDKTYQQWRDRWTVAVTLLRRTQITQPADQH